MKRFSVIVLIAVGMLTQACSGGSLTRDRAAELILQSGRIGRTISVSVPAFAGCVAIPRFNRDLIEDVNEFTRGRSIAFNEAVTGNWRPDPFRINAIADQIAEAIKEGVLEHYVIEHRPDDPATPVKCLEEWRRGRNSADRHVLLEWGFKATPAAASLQRGDRVEGDLAREEFVAVTGISQEDDTHAVAEYSVRLVPTEAGKRLGRSPGPPSTTSVGFQKYDDGWRLQ